MPWTVQKTDKCPASKPYGVVKADGEVEGCHETEKDAEAQRRALYANEGKSMQHLKIKAAATTTTRGEFAALAAAYTVDRVQERIIPGAFEKTIGAWQGSGKMVPLHWDHEGSAENVIGYVDPATMKETDEGLYVEGKLDIKTSPVAREAWRSMKNNAVALSFGYLPLTRKGKDGITEITEVDLFEISIVPAPANADTRLLSLKTLREKMEETSQDKTAVEEGRDEEPEKAKSAPQDPLAKEAWDLITRTANGGPLPKPRKEQEPEPEPEPIDGAAVTREFWALALKTRR